MFDSTAQTLNSSMLNERTCALFQIFTFLFSIVLICCRRRFFKDQQYIVSLFYIAFTVSLQFLLFNDKRRCFVLFPAGRKRLFQFLGNNSDVNLFTSVCWRMLLLFIIAAAATVAFVVEWLMIVAVVLRSINL